MRLRHYETPIVVGFDFDQQTKNVLIVVCISTPGPDTQTAVR